MRSRTIERALRFIAHHRDHGRAAELSFIGIGPWIPYVRVRIFFPGSTQAAGDDAVKRAAAGLEAMLEAQGIKIPLKVDVTEQELEAAAGLGALFG